MQLLKEIIKLTSYKSYDNLENDSQPKRICVYQLNYSIDRLYNITNIIDVNVRNVGRYYNVRNIIDVMGICLKRMFFIGEIYFYIALFIINDSISTQVICSNSLCILVSCSFNFVFRRLYVLICPSYCFSLSYDHKTIAKQ